MAKIDRKVFLTLVEQEAVDVLANMPENYGDVMINTEGDCWGVQVLEEERYLLTQDELDKLEVFPDDFYTNVH